MILKLDHKLFIFEFKIDSEIESGIDQIIEREYHKQFEIDKREIVLVSINFSSRKKCLSGFKLIPFNDLH